jgi:mannobiose 2-epimerase
MNTEKDTIHALRDRMTEDLRKNILPFWLERAQDRENGGFYGEMLRDGTVIKNAGKGLILNARILWTFASAYRIFRESAYRAGADRAFNYIMEHFLDSENGGAYYMLNAKGAPENPMKMTYAQGFLLYAFSEYARATESGRAAEEARKIFRYIEDACKDGDGWLEFARGSPMPPPPPEGAKSEAPPMPEFRRMLTMNTHLHILEPVTAYFRIDHSGEAEASLALLLEIFLDKIYNSRFRSFDLFFADEWKPLSRTSSFGHDIEGSWLIYEAAETLKEFAGDKARAGKLFERAKQCTLDMAEAVLAEGLDPATGAVYEEGGRDGTITNSKRVWWAQAEGVVGFFNAWQLSGDGKFLAAAARAWNYIDAHVIDHAGGEWFGTGTDSPEDENSGYKINAWKCPYHNGRAAFEIYERAERTPRQ